MIIALYTLHTLSIQYIIYLHPSLPRVTHSAAPHSLHSSVREMNGVRRGWPEVGEVRARHERSEPRDERREGKASEAKVERQGN